MTKDPFVDIPTSTKGALRALSSNYSVVEAFGDIPDNSIDAGASVIHINTVPDSCSGRKQAIEKIVIVDNGEGFVDDLRNLKLGYSTKAQSPSHSQIGEYGVGMLASSDRLGDTLTILTKADTEEGKVSAAHINLPDAKARYDFEPSVTREYLNIWNNNRQQAELDPNDTGSILVIEDITQTEYDTVKKLQNALLGTKKRPSYLGKTFGKFICDEKRLQIFVNGQKVQPHDPTMLGESNVRCVYDGSFHAKINGQVEHVGRIVITEIPLELRNYSDDIGISVYKEGRLMTVDKTFFGMIQSKSPYEAASLRISVELDSKNFNKLFQVSSSKNSFQNISSSEDFSNFFRDKYWKPYGRSVINKYIEEMSQRKQEKMEAQLGKWITNLHSTSNSSFPRKISDWLKTNVTKIEIINLGDKTKKSILNNGVLQLNKSNSKFFNSEKFLSSEDFRKHVVAGAIVEQYYKKTTSLDFYTSIRNVF